MRRDLHVVWWSGGPVWARSRLGRPTVFQSSVEGHRGQGTFAGSRFPTPRRCAPLMSGIGAPDRWSAALLLATLLLSRGTTTNAPQTMSLVGPGATHRVSERPLHAFDCLR